MPDHRVLIAGEDELHGATGIHLARRCAALPPTFLCLPPAPGEWFCHKNVEARLRALRASPHRLFLGRVGHPLAREVVLMTLYAEALGIRDYTLVYLRDTDHRIELEDVVRDFETWRAPRRLGLRACVIGAPHPEAEAWVILGLGGHAPVQARRRKLKAELGFDPVLQPASLTSVAHGAATDCKRVLAVLLGDARPDQEGSHASPAAERHAELLDLCFADLDALVHSAPAEAAGLASFCRGLIEALGDPAE